VVFSLASLFLSELLDSFVHSIFMVHGGHLLPSRLYGGAT
jgi:hypothetical protein